MGEEREEGPRSWMGKRRTGHVMKPWKVDAGRQEGAMWQSGHKKVKSWTLDFCHLGEQLVEEHPWGDQGKGPFSARPLRRGFLIGQPLVGTKLGGGRAARVTGT